MSATLSNLWSQTKVRLLGKRVVNFLNRGFINFIDVGSSGGLPSPWNVNADYIHTLLKFEPRDSCRSSRNTISVDTALWSDNEERDFYIYKGHGGTGASLFSQNTDYVRANFETLCRRGSPDMADTWFERSELVGTEKVQCRRLDDVLADLDRDIEFHFFKADAQGAEFEILKGAPRFLETHCVGLHLELLVLPLLTGVTLLPEVERFLADLGFRMIRKYPPHGTFDSQHDCVFLKEGVNRRIERLVRGVYGV